MNQLRGGLVTATDSGFNASGEVDMTAALSPGLDVSYLPVLDVARGIAAGYQTTARLDPAAASTGATYAEHDRDGSLTAQAVSIALGGLHTLPSNTFLTVPVDAAVAAKPLVREALLSRGGLRGVVLDVTGFNGSEPVGDLEYVLAQYRDNGALIAVGGNGAAQPELTSIVRLKPAILRLGRDWVRGVDRSEAKRSAIEVIGHLAGQLDAWILAEGVAAAAELRVLAGLSVPLAQGPLIGNGRESWAAVDADAVTALPAGAGNAEGVLRSLLQQAYTTHDAVAASAVLPETNGFDVVVVLDEHDRPVSILEHGGATAWEASEVLTVNVETAVADAVGRAMLRPRTTRFTPLACTDAAGRFVGILRIERLMAHLAHG